MCLSMDNYMPWMLARGPWPEAPEAQPQTRGWTSRGFLAIGAAGAVAYCTWIVNV